MQPRLYKLAASLWPMLTIALILFLICNIPFSIEAALMNFCFLGWFAKLPGLGHLWFVTMIIICYILFVGLANFRKNFRLIGWFQCLLLHSYAHM